MIKMLNFHGASSTLHRKAVPRRRRPERPQQPQQSSARPSVGPRASVRAVLLSWVQATGRLFFFPDGFVALNRPSFEVFVVLEKTGR